ncbi:unnamed protein product [Rotaria magnacalcarata]|uniref:Uncharacterized protein n=1 Tax=Rotaria magnacalcarata TaxID=392030 RepID=A0A816SVM7_9BILA|nr:unnamed protein product [Rotaria magnacalcarata]
MQSSPPNISKATRTIITSDKWKNKNGSGLDITGRFGHEKWILIFANNETTVEELFDRHKWPDKIADNEFELKVPRIFPAAYSLVIQQFYDSWNINEDHYAGHSECPEVQQIRRQIGQNHKIKRTQLLINKEQDQHLSYDFNKQKFPPLPSSPMQQQQHEDFQSRPYT